MPLFWQARSEGTGTRGLIFMQLDNTRFTGTTPEDCTLVASASALYFTVAANTTSNGVA